MDSNLLKVSVNGSSRLRSFCVLADGPGTHFIRPASEEVNELQCIVSSNNDLGQDGRHRIGQFVLRLQAFQILVLLGRLFQLR